MQEGDIPASTALPDKLWARKYMQGFKKAAPAAAPKPAPAPVAPPEAATPSWKLKSTPKAAAAPPPAPSEPQPPKKTVLKSAAKAVESDHDKFCRLLKAPPSKMTPDLASALDAWDIQERGMAQGLKSADIEWCKEYLARLKVCLFVCFFFFLEIDVFFDVLQANGSGDTGAEEEEEGGAAAEPPPPPPAAKAKAVPVAAPKPSEPVVAAAAPKKAAGKAPAKTVKAAPAAAAPAKSGSGQWPAKMPPFEIPQEVKKAQKEDAFLFSKLLGMGSIFQSVWRADSPGSHRIDGSRRAKRVACSGKGLVEKIFGFLQSGCASSAGRKAG
jgi:hypothetical protein